MSSKDNSKMELLVGFVGAVLVAVLSLAFSVYNYFPEPTPQQIQAMSVTNISALVRGVRTLIFPIIPFLALGYLLLAVIIFRQLKQTKRRVDSL